MRLLLLLPCAVASGLLLLLGAARSHLTRTFRSHTVIRLINGKQGLGAAKGGLLSTDPLRVSLRTCAIHEVALYGRGFFIRCSSKHLFPYIFFCVVYPVLPRLPDSLLTVLYSGGTIKPIPVLIEMDIRIICFYDSLFA